LNHPSVLSGALAQDYPAASSQEVKSLLPTGGLLTSGSFHLREKCPSFKAEQILGLIRPHVRDYNTPASSRIVAPEAWRRAMAKHLEQRIRERAYKM
jgi:hypothetical protein